MIKANIKLLWQNGETVCVTTNCFVKRNGEGVMGRGNALVMAQLIPSLPRCLGEHIGQNGNVVGLIYERVYAFPVKPSNCKKEDALPKAHYTESSIIPGFHCKASVPLICYSSKNLIDIARTKPGEMIYLPVPGKGNGGLSESQSDYRLYLEILKIIEKEPNITLVTL